MSDVVITVAVDASSLQERLEAIAGQWDEVLTRGMAAGAQDVASLVAEKSRAPLLQQRSGDLLSDIQAWPDGEQVFAVGVPAGSKSSRYAWLLTRQDRHIVPKGHPYLAIPIGQNVTGAGLGGRMYGSPRDIPRDQIRWRGRTVGIGVGDEYFPLFALVPEVWIFGRGTLEEAGEESQPLVAGAIRAELDQAIAATGGDA